MNTKIQYFLQAVILSLLFLNFPFISGACAAETFQDNQDGTVTDTRTGLMWSKSAIPLGDQENLTWQQATSLAESFTLAGHSNWRLPTRNELKNFLPDSGNSVATDMVHVFSDLPEHSGRYWTSTTIGDDKAYLITFGITVVETEHSLSVSVEEGEGTIAESETIGNAWLVRDSNHGDPITRERVDFLFDWLESMFPNILLPQPQETKETAGMFFREYLDSGYKLRAMNSSLYLVDPQNKQQNVGDFLYWLGYAKAETLFDWLEGQPSLKEILKPAPQQTRYHEGRFYRYYIDTHFSLFTLQGDLYYIDQNGNSHNAGKVDEWLDQINQ